jgi:hypothetical protein
VAQAAERKSAKWPHRLKSGPVKFLKMALRCLVWAETFYARSRRSSFPASQVDLLAAAYRRLSGPGADRDGDLGTMFLSPLEGPDAPRRKRNRLPFCPFRTMMLRCGKWLRCVTHFTIPVADW